MGLPVADVVVVEVDQGTEQLLHDACGFQLSQVLLLQDEVKQFSALAVPKLLGLRACLTYSSTRKQTSFHSQISCSFIMLSWSYNVARVERLRARLPAP